MFGAGKEGRYPEGESGNDQREGFLTSFPHQKKVKLPSTRSTQRQQTRRKLRLLWATMLAIINCNLGNQIVEWELMNAELSAELRMQLNAELRKNRQRKCCGTTRNSSPHSATTRERYNGDSLSNMGDVMGRSTGATIMEKCQHLSDPQTDPQGTICDLIDYSRAYDSVWKGSLPWKVLEKKVPKKTNRWILAWLPNRWKCVTYPNGKRTCKTFLQGVSQGS